MLWCCLRYYSTVLVWSPLTLCPFPFTVFLCRHLHLSDSNTKENVPRAACFLPSRPCHLEQTPLLCTSCSNTIPLQNSTKNYTILLSICTRLLELLCVFNCTSYSFPPVKLHVTSTCVWVSRGKEREGECTWSSNGLIFSLLVCVFWWHVIHEWWWW